MRSLEPFDDRDKRTPNVYEIAKFSKSLILVTLYVYKNPRISRTHSTMLTLKTHITQEPTKASRGISSQNRRRQATGTY